MSALWALTLISIFAWSVAQDKTCEFGPVPEDFGAAGTLAALEKLPTYSRILYVTAHPDDESGGTLAWLARVAHARVALFSLTRGEGGQNILGDEKYDALGLIRTAELVSACRIYGVEPYFSTAFDFGFSKTPEETLFKWGREASLEELVRFIRMWRPSVVISVWRGDSSDGHGHHQAAGILTKEAWNLAGDPRRFPEHSKLGLSPWQPKKLYVRAGSGARSSSDPDGNSTVALPVGDYSPVLGRSCREIGAEGYGKHRTQGTGASYAPPGRSNDYYKLIASTVGTKPRETGIFDSIDTSLQALSRLVDGVTVPFLQEDLIKAQKAAEEAAQKFRPQHPEECASAVARGSVIMSGILEKLEGAGLQSASKRILKDALEEKARDFQMALCHALGIYVSARVDEPTAAPGEKPAIRVRCLNRGSETVTLLGIKILAPSGWSVYSSETLAERPLHAGEEASLGLSVLIPATAAPTESIVYRDDPNANRYKTHPADNPFVPFTPPVISAEVRFRYQDAEIPVVVAAAAHVADPLRGDSCIDFQVIPVVSVALKPGMALVATAPGAQSREFRAVVESGGKAETSGTLKIAVGSGWSVEPPVADFRLSRKGEVFTAHFTVKSPAISPAGNYILEAAARVDAREYRRGFKTISYPGNWTRFLYSPARTDWKVFDLKIAPQLTVGYIPGAGDETPEALELLGAKIEVLSGQDLESGNLSRFSAIVTGIRAYNVNAELRISNRRLLSYVENGGVLIIQYNRPFREMRASEGGSAFPYGPYPMSNSDADRITVEETPIKILDPNNPVFSRPNKIAAEDFAGWVQERGLYFMNRWDPRYVPLLSGSDPGEPPKEGGMLLARYGKGYYVYTAYSWFRQLPAGIPGAFRIFANLLSLSKN